MWVDVQTEPHIVAGLVQRWWRRAVSTAHHHIKMPTIIETSQYVHELHCDVSQHMSHMGYGGSSLDPRAGDSSSAGHCLRCQSVLSACSQTLAPATSFTSCPEHWGCTWA